MILVTGATGKVGGALVAALREAGAPVRALVRDPARAELPPGVEAIAGDLAVPETLDAALDGVEAVFLVWPFLGSDGAAAVVEAIARHATRVVYLSSMGVNDELERQGDAINQFHADLERLIASAGLAWTFLRAGGFAANTLGWAPQILADGVVRAPFPGAARSLIHERDIADVAARVLLEDGHAGATHVLTGPVAVTQAEQVEAIAAAVGSPVRFEEISPEVAREQMLAYWPASLADAVLDGWATLSRHPEPVTTTVERLLGVPARPFEAWAIDHANDFRG